MLFAEIVAQNPDLGLTRSPATRPTIENEISVDIRGADTGANALEYARTKSQRTDPAAFLYETIGNRSTDHAQHRSGPARRPESLRALIDPRGRPPRQFPHPPLRRRPQSTESTARHGLGRNRQSSEYLPSVTAVRTVPANNIKHANRQQFTDAGTVAARIGSSTLGASNGWELESIPLEVPLMAPIPLAPVVPGSTDNQPPNATSHRYRPASPSIPAEFGSRDGTKPSRAFQLDRSTSTSQTRKRSDGLKSGIKSQTRSNGPISPAPHGPQSQAHGRTLPTSRDGRITPRHGKPYK
jgi:hypothetical protein